MLAHNVFGMQESAKIQPLTMSSRQDFLLSAQIDRNIETLQSSKSPNQQNHFEPESSINGSWQL